MAQPTGIATLGDGPVCGKGCECVPEVSGFCGGKLDSAIVQKADDARVHGRNCPDRAHGENCKCRDVSFVVFAFRDNSPDDGSQDLRRNNLPEERLPAALAWALGHGMDVIHISRIEEPPFRPSIVHHLCSDPACPGGC